MSTPIKDAIAAAVERFERSILAGIDAAETVEPEYSIYPEMKADFRLTRLAHAAFQLGLVHGRLIARAQGRDEMLGRLGAAMIMATAVPEGRQVTPHEAVKLRTVYMAGFDTSHVHMTLARARKRVEFS